MKSEKCRILNFHCSNSNRVKTVSGNFKKIEKKDAKPNQNFFEWRSYYVQFLNCKVAFRPYSASAGFSKKNCQYENFRVDKGLVLSAKLISKKQMESRSIPATIKSHSSFSLNNLNPFIEQVGVTSPFFQDFVQITKKTFLINSSGDFNSEIRDKKTPELFSRSIDRQSFFKSSIFPVVKNSINRTKIAISKNTFGLRQCNSDNQYPYKVDNQSGFLSDRFNNLGADVNKENFINTLQGKYNKFHTLPIFSTFIYKEWSHRFSFLEYFIWSAQKNDLALPFYIRRDACHTARINSMNLIRNKIGLKKTTKQFLFSFNGCTKNILWNERFQKVPWLEVITNKNGENQSSKKRKKQLPKTISFTGGDQATDSTSFRASFDDLYLTESNIKSRSKEGDPVVDSLKSTHNLSNRRLDWLYSSGASKNTSNFSQMPTPPPKSEDFLELRDKAVSLTLCVESNNLTKLSSSKIPSTVNVKENSIKFEDFNKQLELKSSFVFRQMENFFGWEFSLSSENVAIKNSSDFYKSISVKNHALMNPIPHTPTGFRGSGGIPLQEKSLDAANKKELLLGMDDNLFVQPVQPDVELEFKSKILNVKPSVKKEGGQWKEIAKIKPKISLASGKFRQLAADLNKEPSDKNQIQSTRWQKSSLMIGKVDDTQQFPRLAELLHFTGGKALRHLLSRFHLVLLGKFLRHELKNLELKVNFLLALKILTYSQGLLLGKLAKRRSKQIRRLKLLELFQSKKSNPEWMILSVLPVLPPDLRPILRVNDDFVVASDLNRLYQTVLRRNNTIHERLDDPLPCPESGLFRQRSLQKAVDGLLENGKGGGTPLCASKRRPLVSLSHVLKGKKGLFRQHLLGKRVDYSGRSVIVVGPKLNLHECGLPKEMALELFQPFLIHRLKVKGLATSNTTARRMIQQEDPIIWHTVKQLVYEHPVLLNRAPTLHRLGIQAFQPRLVSGRAILLHPLVCNGFNADFDGDQMAVHVPLSFQARAEAWKIMWSKNNLLSPATGQPILVPSQDMVLGCYYLSVVVPRALRFPKSKKNIRVFSNQGDASKTGMISFADQSKIEDFKPISWSKKEENVNEDSFTIKGLVNKKVSSSFLFNYVKPVTFFNSQRQFAGNRKHQENSFKIFDFNSGYFKKTEIKNFSEYFKDKVNLFAKFSTVKSCKFIHSPGYFKKTQHLGFLTNANLLQKMDTMEMSQKTLDFQSRTHFSLINFNKVKKEADHDNLCYWLREPRRGKINKVKSNVDEVNKKAFSFGNGIDKVNQWQEKTSIENSKKSDRTMLSPPEISNNSTYLFERGHYFSSLHDSLMAYAQGRLQTHTPFWVRLDYSVVNEKKKTSVLHTNYPSTFLQVLQPKIVQIVPSSNPHGVKKRVLQTKETEIISLVDQQYPSLLQPRYGCSQQVSKVLFQEDHHRFVIEGNDALEAPLELRLGADGNLVKIFTTFQNHYSCNTTILDQCKEKSIRYMRTTAGRVVINETLFHF